MLKFAVVKPLLPVTTTALFAKVNGVEPEASKVLEAVRFITRVVVFRVASSPLKASVPPPRFTVENSAPKPRELGARSPTVFTERTPALTVVEPV